LCCDPEGAYCVYTYETIYDVKLSRVYAGISLHRSAFQHMRIANPIYSFSFTKKHAHLSIIYILDDIS
jgi:hypothetical protein